MSRRASINNLKTEGTRGKERLSDHVLFTMEFCFLIFITVWNDGVHCFILREGTVIIDSVIVTFIYIQVNFCGVVISEGMNRFNEWWDKPG